MPSAKRRLDVVVHPVAHHQRRLGTRAAAFHRTQEKGRTGLGDMRFLRRPQQVHPPEDRRLHHR
jgi:hypothetical protein